MFAIPNVALENAMACRVFRILKFDSTRAAYVDTIMTEVAASGSETGPRRVGRDSEFSGSHALVQLRQTQITVDVTKEVNHDGLDYPYKHDMA
jgi:hypothetical protein